MNIKSSWCADLSPIVPQNMELALSIRQDNFLKISIYEWFCLSTDKMDYVFYGLCILSFCHKVWALLWTGFLFQTLSKQIRNSMDAEVLFRCMHSYLPYMEPPGCLMDGTAPALYWLLYTSEWPGEISRSYFQYLEANWKCPTEHWKYLPEASVAILRHTEANRVGHQPGTTQERPQ